MVLQGFVRVSCIFTYMLLFRGSGPTSWLQRFRYLQKRGRYLVSYMGVFLRYSGALGVWEFEVRFEV